LEDLNELSKQITGGGVPGHLGAAYQEALRIEFGDSGLYRRQVPFPIRYQGNVVGGLDLLVEDAVLAAVMNLPTCLMHEGIQRFVL
jgi:hypothetical protein